jgi:hypothetical protein
MKTVKKTIQKLLAIRLYTPSQKVIKDKKTYSRKTKHKEKLS